MTKQEADELRAYMLLHGFEQNGSGGDRRGGYEAYGLAMLTTPGHLSIQVRLRYRESDLSSRQYVAMFEWAEEGASWWTGRKNYTLYRWAMLRLKSLLTKRAETARLLANNDREIKP